jgi:hypothetical protein
VVSREQGKLRSNCKLDGLCGWSRKPRRPPKTTRAPSGATACSSRTNISLTNLLGTTPPPLVHRQHTLRRRSTPTLSPPPTLVLHTAAMFKQLIPRASTRGALSSGFSSAQALRSTAPSTTLIQQRIWQRRGYATETGMDTLPLIYTASWRASRNAD